MANNVNDRPANKAGKDELECGLGTNLWTGKKRTKDPMIDFNKDEDATQRAMRRGRSNNFITPCNIPPKRG